jgi:hypothetical protein
MFAFSAAGFIATSTFGASPGVVMSWSAKASWNAETPPMVPRRLGGEPVARHLHAVAGVTGKTDHDTADTDDLLAHGLPLIGLEEWRSGASHRVLAAVTTRY